MITINETILINPLHKNIAIRLSGGPDSSIIYYALCNFFKDNADVNLYPYTLSTPLRPHSGKKAKHVIEIVGKLTGRYATKHYELFNSKHNIDNNVDSNSYEYTNGQEELEQTVINECNLDSIYTGLSINCPIVDLSAMVENNNKYKNERRLALTYRDETRDAPFTSTIENAYGITMYMPFAHSDKRTVFNLYKYYNLLDTLYPITWSCENNDQITQEDPVHCGVCYFCLERLYAFGKL